MTKIMTVIGNVGSHIFWSLIEIYIFIADKFLFIYYLLFPKDINSILYIKDGKEYRTCGLYYDLVIVTKNEYKRIYKNIKYVDDLEKVEVIPLEYNFVNAEIEIPSSSQKFSINLNKFFFVEKSVVYSKELVMWYLRKHYNYQLHRDTEYNITIIDNNVGIKNLTEKNYIILGKTDYTILPRVD